MVSAQRGLFVLQIGLINGLRTNREMLRTCRFSGGSVGLQLYLLPLPCSRALQQTSEGKREKSDSVQEAVRVK